MRNLSSKNRFLILGCSVSGTSLLHGLLNHHPDIHCKYEWFRYKNNPNMALKDWIDDADKHREKLWGNKIPIEQFWSDGAKDRKAWDDLKLVQLIDYFKIIFIQRRFSQYAKQNASNNNFKKWWRRANYDIYWGMRERSPERIIAISFEDLVLRPKTELARVCEFIGVEMQYEQQLKGTANRKSKLSTIGFDLSRV